jgi:hypothetical protein
VNLPGNRRHNRQARNILMIIIGSKHPGTAPMTVEDAIARLDAIAPDRFWINENRDHRRPGGYPVRKSHWYIHDEKFPRECLGSGATLEIAIEIALRRLTVKAMAAIIRNELAPNEIDSSKRGVPASVGLDAVASTVSQS